MKANIDPDIISVFVNKITVYYPHIGTLYDMFGNDFVNDIKSKRKKAYRAIMKTINCGIIFGMGVNKMVESLMESDLALGRGRVEEILRDYYKKYPVREFMDGLTSELYKQGSITLKVNSKLMNFTREYRVPKRLAYKGANIKIQGMAAYVMKHGMVRVDKLIKKKKCDAYMIGTLHDEIIIEVNKKLNQKLIVKQLVNAIEDKVSFSLPILASVKWGSKSWGEVVDWKN